MDNKKIARKLVRLAGILADDKKYEDSHKAFDDLQKSISQLKRELYNKKVNMISFYEWVNSTRQGVDNLLQGR